MSLLLYIAGPMSSHPEDANFPAFHKAAEQLRAMGHVVFSPAENDVIKGWATYEGKVLPEFNIRNSLGDDLAWICKFSDGVALLEGWERSTGAIAESSTANALGLKRYIQVHDQWLEIDSNGRVTGEVLS